MGLVENMMVVGKKEEELVSKRGHNEDVRSVTAMFRSVFSDHVTKSWSETLFFLQAIGVATAFLVSHLFLACVVLDRSFCP